MKRHLFVCHSQSAFTLVELLIAMVILAFIATFTAGSIQNSIRFKNKYQKNVEAESKLKSAMAVMERDLSLAFHYQDPIAEMNRQIRKELEKEKTQQPGQFPPPQPLGGQVSDNAPAKSWTKFLGTEQRIDLVSRANVRLVANSPQSDLLEVGYQLKACNQRASKELNSQRALQCLWRRTSPIVDDRVEEGGSEQLLAVGVVQFQLRYLGEEKDEWQSTWYSDDRGDASTKGRFPKAVEISLTLDVGGPSGPVEKSMVSVALLKFPNNPDQNSGVNGNQDALIPPPPPQNGVSPSGGTPR